MSDKFPVSPDFLSLALDATILPSFTTESCMCMEAILTSKEAAPKCGPSISVSLYHNDVKVKPTLKQK